MKPLIAIVGRPNVGKSMLFNKLVGQRLSIVEDTPGVTRDRLYAEAEWRNRKFDLVDTGGIEPSADSQILAFMRQQAEMILWHLMDAGTLRYHELHRRIPRATDKMLAQQLRELERDGLLRRAVYPVVPPKTEYSLTDFGRSLAPILDEMCRWGEWYLAQSSSASSSQS